MCQRVFENFQPVNSYNGGRVWCCILLLYVWVLVNGGGGVGVGWRAQISPGVRRPMKYSGDRLVEVVEVAPAPRSRGRGGGRVADVEELTSPWHPALTFSDATQTTEDDESTLRDLLMRYLANMVPACMRSVYCAGSLETNYPSLNFCIWWYKSSFLLCAYHKEMWKICV